MSQSYFLFLKNKPIKFGLKMKSFLRVHTDVERECGLAMLAARPQLKCMSALASGDINLRCAPPLNLNLFSVRNFFGRSRDSADNSNL
jgi:hypothetical protein